MLTVRAMVLAVGPLRVAIQALMSLWSLLIGARPLIARRSRWRVYTIPVGLVHCVCTP